MSPVLSNVDEREGRPQACDNPRRLTGNEVVSLNVSPAGDEIDNGTIQ
jgi:hypothetical protein